MIDSRLFSLAAQFVSAFADGKVDAAEATALIEGLLALIPTEDLTEDAGGLIEDLLYRDADELEAAAERKREAAAEARATGKPDKGVRLDKRADVLETKAIERRKSEG